MTSLENTGTAVRIVYLDVSEAFDAVSHNFLTEKGTKCRLDRWTVRWVQNWLNSRAQGIVVSDTKSSWRPVTSGVSKGSVLRPIMFNVCFNHLDGRVQVC